MNIKIQSERLEQAKRIIQQLWEYKNQWNAQTELISILLRESKNGIDYAKLKKENNKLKKCLEWYADIENYIGQNSDNDAGLYARRTLDAL